MTTNRCRSHRARRSASMPRRLGGLIACELARAALAALLLLAALPMSARAAAAAPPASAAAPPASAATAPTTSSSEDPLDALIAAERSYEEGMALLRQDPAEARRRFDESARLYSRIRDAGADNAAIHFNLGNAQLQASRIGEAIASYLRAQRASPGETRVQRNLAHARSLVPERFESVGATTLLENAASWWHVVSLRARWWGAIGAWVLLWALVLAVTLRPSMVSGEGASIAWRWMTVAAILAVVIFGGTVAADALLDRWRPRGVVVEHGVVVRKGNGEGFEPQFQETLGEGVEFRVRDRRPGWIEIELPNGRSGWIREADAAVI